MGVAVICLTDDHYRRLVVTPRRHHASHAIVDDLLKILLATEQDFDILMQTATTVETGVDNDAVAEVVLAQNLGINITVAGISHAADVDIAQLTV